MSQLTTTDHEKINIDIQVTWQNALTQDRMHSDRTVHCTDNVSKLLTQTNHSVWNTNDLGVLDAAGESSIDKTLSIHDNWTTSTQPLYNLTSYTATSAAIHLIIIIIISYS